ncbi:MULTISPECIES: PaaX family transcriptional regulator C-terminal domain-containing protein [unclassified Nocardioides]|uniref:PaaX family transcriptional regulator C-terminal domain-containing protein n=1 Tax=unclassified Nocardioides TaxID=2615069 RepID=UPI00115252FA|nr:MULTISPECIES: PaaX family transcriptional regulator C-terminal domain-containing protein [unclassified Nocardioides]TQK71222.1 PaaX family transcriptional regulator [Nocardioides sp. SLBN-35]WGY04611.1 PaaX family transcriptional regulator C-terminal domain-containing protein [Nocardioides sp. QY071]
MPDLKPVSTRSALLTLLLGAEVPRLTTRELVAAASVVGFAEPTVRVALSRMATAGDVVRDDEGAYRLSERLVVRQRRQEEATHPSLREWDGTWELVAVTTVGRTASERAELRAALAELRLAELREGVWTRPANLALAWPEPVDEVCERFTAATPAADAASLSARLWDLSAWAATARRLLDATDTEDPVLRFTACATSGRHLLTDPVLPPALLPDDWPGDALRASHVAYKQWVVDMRHSLTDGAG